MSPKPAGACTLLVASAFAGTALAQSTTNKTREPAATVSLDQVNTGGETRAAGADRAADLDIPQPSAPPRAAAVTSSEISTRAEGRSVGVTSIAGSDQCDAPKDAARAELCRQRLETRASQYSRPKAAPVTAEGRLLLLVNPNGAASTGMPDGRQLGPSAGLNDPNGPAEQLAGALREQGSGEDQAAGANGAKSSGSSALPAGVPAVVVLPPK